MKNQITYTEAKELFNKYLKTEYLRFHSRESEVIMRKLANRLGEDEEMWGITGLLHDLDLDLIDGDYRKHGFKTVDILFDEGYILPQITTAIISHVEGIEGNVVKRETKLDYCLASAENLTGLISAYVLMRPDKKIAGVKAKSIKKKFKSKSFAEKVNREFIEDITKVTDLELNDFFQLAIDAMAEIADEINM
ncbi:MAG: HD domain-containing protein [Candidatus Marinimicrobia bacterium]|nr:HD domain-containing protein [Candidatus Neomarinimicrobiota bacterium]